MGDKTERWFQLCQQAAVEQDPDKLIALITEINDILENRERVAHNPEPTEEEWRELARQAGQEKDSEKLTDLAQRIVEKYDAAQRKKN